MTTVRELHETAMAHAQQGQVLWHRSMAAFREAADWERQAVEKVRPLPNNQPTLRILEVSLRSLELMAEGKPETADAMESETA